MFFGVEKEMTRELWDRYFGPIQIQLSCWISFLLCYLWTTPTRQINIRNLYFKLLTWYQPSWNLLSHLRIWSSSRQKKFVGCWISLNNCLLRKICVHNWWKQLKLCFQGQLVCYVDFILTKMLVKNASNMWWMTRKRRLTHYWWKLYGIMIRLSMINGCNNLIRHVFIVVNLLIMWKTRGWLHIGRDLLEHRLIEYYI